MTGFTKPEIEWLAAAYRAELNGDGWLLNANGGIWRTAPKVINKLRAKGLLEVIPQYGRAKLSRKGRALVGADPERFGITGALQGARL